MAACLSAQDSIKADSSFISCPFLMFDYIHYNS
nr:MAG TPA: hypothetical protein [Caudoviricetes sp.]